MQHDNTSTIHHAARVVLAADYGFFDQGDVGVVTSLDHTADTAVVHFDGGGVGVLPLAVLAHSPAPYFTYSLPGHGPVRRKFASEEEAAEAAQAADFDVFDVVEVRHVAAYSLCDLSSGADPLANF